MRHDVVIGIGNRERRDEGFGPSVIDVLRRRHRAQLPTGVRLTVVDGRPDQLSALWSHSDRAVLIDVLHHDPVHPARVHRLRVDGAGRPWLDAGLRPDLNAALVRSQPPPATVLFGIEGVDFGVGSELSPPLDSMVDHVATLVAGELARPLSTLPA